MNRHPRTNKVKFISALICILLLIGIMPFSAFSAQKSDDIVILYENDVHCEIDGYSKLSAMKKELMGTHNHVAVVSSGDYIQGSSIGTISRGEYIVRLMNLVGYDAVALGNHEFDFKLDRLGELVDMMNTKPICANFERLSDGTPYFEPYRIVSYGDVDIAYIGITTPTTTTSSSPAQFRDENNKLIVTFHASDLAPTVQKHVDAARAEGADYVIALSHLGDKEPAHNAHELIPEISGVDVFLDAHSHSVIEHNVIKDKNGEDVIVSSTGTKFENIGKLTISDGVITTELIKTDTYEKTDPVVDACLAEINEEYAALGNKKIAYSEVDLITHDADGNRIVRVGETNLGDFVADAIRTVLGADIAYMNGGGLRAPISKGEVTYNDLLNVLPYNNCPVMIEAKGQAIWDMLELTTCDWPGERGGFPHVSGIKFSVNTAIESSVTFDENNMFVSVDGEYRVYNVQVLDRESGEYKPLDPDKTYTLAGQNHSLLNGGGSITMFNGAKVVKNTGEIDVDVITTYITEHLGGVIGTQYATVSPNITFTDGVILPDDDDNDSGNSGEENTPDTPAPTDDGDGSKIIIVCTVIGVCVGACVGAGLAAYTYKKRQKSK